MITTTHDIDFQRFEIGKNGRFKEIKEGLFRVKTKKKNRWNLVCVGAEKEAGFISWAKLYILIFLKIVQNHFKQKYHINSFVFKQTSSIVENTLERKIEWMQEN